MEFVTKCREIGRRHVRVPEGKYCSEEERMCRTHTVIVLDCVLFKVFVRHAPASLFKLNITVTRHMHSAPFLAQCS